MSDTTTGGITTGLGSNYWKLWTASVVSNLGDGLSGIAYPWLASAITRSPIHLAGMVIATRLPWALFSLPAGVITDRVDRRKLIGWMDAFRFGLTLAVATLVAFGAGGFPDPAALAAGAAEPPANQLWWLAMLYGSALLFGFAEVLRDNAAQTLMPSVVRTDQLERANGRLWGAEMVMNSFVGPPLAGVLIAVTLALPFFVDAATFLVSAVLILAITGDFRTKQAMATARTKIDWWGEIKEGMGWLWRHRLLRSLAIILGLMNALMMMTLSTYVFFVQEILELNASQFGLLMTAGAIGGVVGSATAGQVSKRLGSGTALFVSIAILTIQFLITGLTSSAIVVWVLFFVGTLGAVVWNVITVSLRQQIIPDDLLGRVNSVYRFLAWGMMPIGAALGGVVVAVAEALTDNRTLALRAPFFAATAVMVGIFIAALSRLTTARLEAARQAASD